MLSYRHAFHAGNHADILKHSLLTLVLQSLHKKEKPFSLIDTHAGAGIYVLDDERAEKTGEAAEGSKISLTSICQKKFFLTSICVKNIKWIINIQVLQKSW